MELDGEYCLETREISGARGHPVLDPRVGTFWYHARRLAYARGDENTNKVWGSDAPEIFPARRVFFSSSLMVCLVTGSIDTGV